MIRIALFASGSGTNVENIINYFKNSELVSVDLVLSNKANAFVLERAKKLGVKTIVFSKQEMEAPEKLVQKLINTADYIVLAGFLLKIPSFFIDLFPNKIINIHPALLPKYGGKGMYGMHVHQAVVENREAKSGITIHYVNESYDEGAIIFQKEVFLSNTDTPEDVAKKIHQLEYEYFPKIIEQVILNNYGN